MHELSPKECLSFGWTTFKSRPSIFIVSSIVLLALSMISRIPNSFLSKDPHGIEILFAVLAFLVSAIVSFLVSMGKTSLYLKAHDAVEHAELSDLWHPKPFLKFVGASVVAGLATVIGLILFIVPGIIVGIMVSMATYLVIERGLGPVEAIKESARITKGNRWNLFILGLALLGINILGVLAVLIGLFVSIPVSTLAVVHAYRVLSGTTAIHHTSVATAPSAI